MNPRPQITALTACIICIVISTHVAAQSESFKPANKHQPDSQQATFAPQEISRLQLEKGDHICLVGNELGERMQHQNFFENLLHSEFPQHQLTVRNLCFPGDEPQQRIRSLNFGSPDAHLAHSDASVILFFFGYNESFAGKAGLEDFKQDIDKLLTDTKRLDYNGDGNSARIVLVSPTAFEGNRFRKHLPDHDSRNADIELYTDAMQQLAAKHNVGFADVFTPTKLAFSKSDKPLTINGASLNEDGYRTLAPILFKSLFAKAAPALDQKLTSEIANKNFHWWHRHRAVNGFSIYGTRGNAGKDGSGKFTNRKVMYRELNILDQMTANRDARIWKLAAGQSVPKQCNDDNTLPFLEPTTNVGIPDDPNAARGKLGSLKYFTAAEQLKLFELADGYEINLVASEEDFPELQNPVALNFDEKGRLWVATMSSYPHWQPKSKLDDKILIFEDDNADGKADRCKVFADGLHQPTGFEIGHGGAYIAQQPDILFVKDTDGDDKADTRIRRIVGLGSADSHHGTAAFTWGPAGTLFFQEGTFKFSQVESPYGLHRLGEAGMWRFDRRTEKIRPHVSFTFSNPWGLVFDRWGQAFIGDASGGHSYWATPISGHIEFPLKHPGGSHDRRVQKLVGKEKGYRYNRLYTKRTRPLAGCEIVSSRHFPDDVQGNWLVTNCIGERCVLNHNIQQQGSGFWGTEQPAIVSCKDGNFRPVDCQFAPDGSLYIVDWHNALIGHLQHNLRDPNRDHMHGRIWRVTHKDRPLLKPAKIDGAPIESLLELLKAYEDRTRYRAKREIAQRPESEVIPAIKKWIAGLNQSDDQFEHHLLEGLWLHQMFNVIDEELLDQLLTAKDARARAAATHVLSNWLDSVPNSIDLLSKMVKDSHPRVRLEAVRALSFMTGEEAILTALEVLDHGDVDYYLQYTLDETMRALEDSQ